MSAKQPKAAPIAIARVRVEGPDGELEVVEEVEADVEDDDDDDEASESSATVYL